MGKAGVILMFAALAGFAPGTANAGLSPLEAISMIESGNNDAAVGPAGEVSRYQIRPHVWRQWTASNAYGDMTVASGVAQRQLEWLAKYFTERAGRAADDFDLYVMWNAGADYYRRVGFSKERVHRKVRDRAQRFVNLRQMRPAAEPPLRVASATPATR